MQPLTPEQVAAIDACAAKTAAAMGVPEHFVYGALERASGMTITLGDQTFPVRGLALDSGAAPTVVPFKWPPPTVTVTVDLQVTKNQMRQVRKVLGLPKQQPHTKRPRLHGGRLPKRNRR